jgi:hypothetical protein
VAGIDRFIRRGNPGKLTEADLMENLRRLWQILDGPPHAEDHLNGAAAAERRGLPRTADLLHRWAHDAQTSRRFNTFNSIGP